MRTKEWKGPARCGLALLAAALTASPAGAAENTYAYYYFKERLPLQLDTTRVAMLRTPDEPGAVVQPDLSHHAHEVTSLTAMAVRGWWFAETTPAARTADAIERAVREIAGQGAVDFVSPVFLDDKGEPLFITSHLMVGFDTSLQPARAEEILNASQAGEIVERDWAHMKRTYRLQSASRDGFEVLRAANALAQRPQVTFAEPDMMITGHVAMVPNDPYFPNLWGLHNDGTFPALACTLPDFDMDAPEAWDITTGEPSVVVAVLDSGVQLDHPDLNLRLPGFDATVPQDGGGPVNACDRHGTPVAGFVSGIINDALGVVGVAPGVKTAPVRVFVSSLTCNDSFTMASSWPVAALDWAQGIGARITNASWGRITQLSGLAEKYLQTRNASPGMVHFAAAGNSFPAGLDTIVYPASLPGVNAVAALEACGGRAFFSHYGVGLDFSAPGHYGISTDRTGSAGYNDGVGDGVCTPNGTTIGCSSDADCPPGDTCFLVSVDDALFVGTSMASPYAAGVAALALSVNPALSAGQLEDVLRLSAVDLGPAGYDTDYGWGFVNAFNAVQVAQSTPGEASALEVTSFDPITGNLNLSYVPACGSTSHDIYYGALSSVSSYGWEGATCGVGASGQVAGFHPGPGSYFFVIVGNASGVEGSFGDPGVQRPAAGSTYCGRIQLPGSACP